jgi:hypothetical protein
MADDARVRSLAELIFAGGVAKMYEGKGRYSNSISEDELLHLTNVSLWAAEVFNETLEKIEQKAVKKEEENSPLG